MSEGLSHLTEEEKKDYLDNHFEAVESGPLGGDQEVGAYIAQKQCAACFLNHQDA